jgi:hypothetical protein
MPTFLPPAASSATALGSRSPVLTRAAEAYRRWLAAFIAARMRRAAIEVLRHLDDHIPYASGEERASLVARAEALRRSLQ